MLSGSPLKVLVFTRYTRMGASSRLRFLQFLSRFEEAGVSCRVFSLLDDRYLQELYGKGRVRPWRLASCYLRGIRRLCRLRGYDAVLLEKECFPYLPPFAEWWLNLRGVPYIVDYDDAIFHNYDLHPSRLVRTLLGGKIASVMRRAQAVVCGNEYLAGYARKAGSARVTVIPTVIDTARYLPSSFRESGSAVVIGWIGSPYSLKYLKSLAPVLARLCAEYPVRLHIVGGKEGIGLGDREVVLQWSEAREVELISAFDIGIMPLEDTPWEQGKCGYKLIQYMGCALPVVGSPVGVNEDLIRNGVNGFQARDPEEWRIALERLITQPALRRELGMNGRKMVEESYSLDRAADLWGLLFDGLRPDNLGKLC